MTWLNKKKDWTRKHWCVRHSAIWPNSPGIETTTFSSRDKARAYAKTIRDSVQHLAIQRCVTLGVETHEDLLDCKKAEEARRAPNRASPKKHFTNAETVQQAEAMMKGSRHACR